VRIQSPQFNRSFDGKTRRHSNHSTDRARWFDR
jgi:hypothetical protein